MGETTTSETGGAALTLSDVREAASAAATEAATQALEAYDKARKERKAAKVRETAPAAETSGETAVTETDEQRIERIVAERLAAAGVRPPVAETEEQKVERLVAERLAAAGAGSGETVQETEDQRLTRLVQERVQGLVADGSILIQRAGIVEEHTAPTEDTALDTKGLAELPEDDFQAYAGGALDKYLGASSNRISAVHA